VRVVVCVTADHWSRGGGCVGVVCCVGSGPCDGLITGLEEVSAWLLCVV